MASKSNLNTTLANDLDTRQDILNEAMAMATSFLDKQDDLAPGRNIPSLDAASLPDKGRGAISALRLFQKEYAHLLSNSAGPRYFGFVTGGSTPAALAADWLVSAYDQNACGSNDSIAPQIEHQTIGFFRQLFGLDDSFFGSFVTGATMSNFTGLALGRQWVGEQRGVDFSQDGARDVSYVSGTPHSSVIKSLSMLGAGRRSMVYVDTLPNREAVDVNALEKKLNEINGPCVVIANAGTVNTVDFDDIEAIADLKKRHSFWLHIDAAFGGFAACSPKFAHYAAGLNLADSLTVDAHKWLNVPYDAAMQFTRHKHIQLKVFQNSAAYLGNPEESPDFFHYTPENSRRFRALPSWMTLMAYGREGYRDIVERNCDAASYLGELISSSDNFELLAPVKMNVVCFTLSSHDEGSAQAIKAFLNAVRDDGRVFFTPTVLKGRTAMRAAVSNWQTERSDIDIAFSALNDTHKNLLNVAASRV
ncbi:aminotransferase class I/II-fold pyridoxal phosphate-dependent enzyme [Chryseolinea sp. T2]|uniref:pyridoxal phosphate-dependent decarboxylase family protein n=1 Tax=Chryseolinea sp. T2 TaxID=3129255 RepID=UPI00307867AC